MKTVFNNSELTHIWANQQQAYGKGSNMFFENDSIYSYGYHFKIAQFVVNKHGQKCIFLNDRSYSSTTNKHQSLVWRAIPSEFEFYRVKEFFNDPNFATIPHRENIANYLTQAENLKTKILKAKKHKLGYVQQLKNTLHTLEQYQLFFDILDLTEFTYASLQGLSVDERLKNICEWFGPYQVSDEFKKWITKKEENDKKEELKRIEEAKEKIEKFRDFKVSSIWNLGINLLRYNKETNEIETSGGVKMPKSIFFEAYERLKNNTLQIGQHIGSYRFNGKHDDILQIGCHKIPLKEVESVVSCF
jgi:hypothetical protein